MFLKDQEILTPQGLKSVQTLKKDQEVLVLNTLELGTAKVSVVSSQRGDSSSVRLTLEGLSPALFAAEATVYRGLPAGRKGPYVALVQCADVGYCLSLLESLPQASGQSPVFQARSLQKTWPWQKIWVVRGFSTMRTADHYLRYKSLMHQIPVLDMRVANASMEEKELLDSLMRDLETLKRGQEIRQIVQASDEPDFIFVQNPEMGGPLFGFTAEEQGEVPVFRLLFASASLPRGDIPAGFRKVTSDLLMHEKGFSSQNEAREALAQSVPGRETVLLNRISLEGHLFQRSQIRWAFPMSYVVGMSALGKPGPVRVLEHEFTERPQTLMDVRLNHPGLVLSQNVGIELGE